MRDLRLLKADVVGLKKSFLLVHVALPLLLGGLIYLCWRDSGLLMFKWFRALDGESLIISLRQLTAPARPFLPSWLVYSLPDGLWVYALTAFMGHVWLGSRSSVLKFVCLAAGPVLGAGSELGQLAHLVPGSFDWADLGFYIFAAAFAFFAASRSNTTRSINEQSNKENFTFVSRIGNFFAAGIRQRVLDE